MIDLQRLIELDKAATLALNGSDSLFLDAAVKLFSSMLVWLPLALVIIFIVLRNNQPRCILWILVMLALTVVATDQISSSICKPLFARFRPTQDSTLFGLVDTVAGYRGGLYGFISSHAANSFGVVTFFVWLFRNRTFSISAITWAILNCLTRAYLGVHFLGDLIFGTLAGIILGTAFYWLFRTITGKESNLSRYYSKALYTSSGYLLEDLSLFHIALFGTYIFIILYATISQGILPY